MKFEKCKSHKICYIRIRRGKVDDSELRDGVVIDRDKKGRIIGIEFWDGLEDRK